MASSSLDAARDDPELGRRVVVGMEHQPEIPGDRGEAPYNTEADLAVGLAPSSRRKRGDHATENIVAKCGCQPWGRAIGSLQETPTHDSFIICLNRRATRGQARIFSTSSARCASLSAPL